MQPPVKTHEGLWSYLQVELTLLSLGGVGEGRKIQIPEMERVQEPMKTLGLFFRI